MSYKYIGMIPMPEREAIARCIANDLNDVYELRPDNTEALTSINSLIRVKNLYSDGGAVSSGELDIRNDKKTNSWYWDEMESYAGEFVKEFFQKFAHDCDTSTDEAEKIMDNIDIKKDMVEFITTLLSREYGAEFPFVNVPM